MQLSTDGLLEGIGTGLLLGAGYGYLQAPRSHRKADAKHYALLGATVGAFVGGIILNRSLASTEVVATNQ